MKNIYLVVIFLFFGDLVNLQSLRAQHPFYYNINDETGLPVNEVYKIVQDKEGFVWIGCDAGLYRYDGFDFKLYRHEAQIGRSMSSLTVDSSNTIWCRNFTGQIFAYYKDSLYLVHQNQPGKEPVVSFFVDGENTVWLIAGKSLIRKNRYGKQLEQWNIRHTLADSMTPIAGLITGHQLLLSYMPKASILSVDLKTKEVQQQRIPSVPLKLKSFFYQQNNTLFIFNKSDYTDSFQVFKKNESTANWEIYYQGILKQTRLYDVFVKDNETLWLCTSGGIVSVDHQFRLSSNVYFNKKNISSILKDRENQYWCTDLENGIYVIPHAEVSKYDHRVSEFPENAINVIKADGNKLLLGFLNGSVFVFDVKTKKFEPLQKPTQNTVLSVKSIESYQGNIYVAHGSLNQYDVTLRFKKDLMMANARSFAFLKDSLYAITPEMMISEALADLGKKEMIQKIRHTGGRAIIADETTQSIFVGFNDGLYKYQQGRFTEITLSGRHLTVSCLAKQGDKILIGTNSAGLLQYAAGKLSVLYQGKLPLENDIKAIAANDQYIWFSNGIAIYRLEAGKPLIDLSEWLGIGAKNINCIALSNRSVYLGGYKGFYEFPQQLTNQDGITPTVKIEKIINGNKVLRNDSIIELSYDQNQLGIQYSVPYYRGRGNYSVSYRFMEGDTNWVSNAASGKSIFFSSVPPGKHVLQIRVEDRSGNTYPSRVLRIHVDEPIWMAWWFYLILLAIVVFVLLIIYKVRIRVIQQETIKEQKLIQSQLTAIKAQMNPHFIYNALNSIQEYILKNDIKNSNYYLTKFSNLMRKVLDVSGAARISLQEEINMQLDYLELEKLRFGEEFSYDILIDKGVETEQIFLPPMLLQPFVENAIKHGLLHLPKAKKLVIKFRIEEVLVCEITDNGVGRAKAAEIQSRQSKFKTSFATTAMEKRMELLQRYTNQPYSVSIEDLIDEQQEPCGTRVILKIPLTKANNKE